MNLEPISVLSESHVIDLHALYQGEWWTRGRTLDQVRQMLAAPQVIIAFAEPDSGRLVGFTRVLTDGVFKGLVLDVIVAPAYRGKGLGRLLLDAVVQHPALQGVKHLELYCRPEVKPLYERWGFTAELGDIYFMRRTLA